MKRAKCKPSKSEIKRVYRNVNASVGYFSAGVSVPVGTGKPLVGRNEACSCGSGKKWKRCCGARASGQLDLSILPGNFYRE